MYNCHGKSINLAEKKNNLTAKRKTSRQKENYSKQKENLTAKRLTAVIGHFNSYFLCREVVVILFAVCLFLFAVRFFFLL